jgi:hypothetical protein
VRDALNHGPIISQDVTTAADGSFQTLFVVKWESMCQHPGALHIAFGDLKEHDLLTVAELLPLPTSPQQCENRSDLKSDHSTSQMSKSQSTPTTLRITLTHSPICVISDIDDTIKLSDILKGARTVFRNVFVKELQDTIIPGMGEWYSDMWKRGVRFHYVVSFFPPFLYIMFRHHFCSQTALLSCYTFSASSSKFRKFHQVR